MARSVEIKLRCSEVEKVCWQEVADQEGKSLSNWVRDVLEDAAAEFFVEPTDREVISTVGQAKRVVGRLGRVAGGCSFDSPRGTRCKVCGKVH